MTIFVLHYTPVIPDISTQDGGWPDAASVFRYS